MSEIDNKYVQLGGARSFLGKATSSETTSPDRVGRHRHYEQESIYWHPQTGPREVHGLIQAKWTSLHNAHIQTRASWGLSYQALLESQVDGWYKRLLDQMVGKPLITWTEPEGRYLLSAKVMRNGEMNR
jgi:hypothetical protein